MEIGNVIMEKKMKKFLKFTKTFIGFLTKTATQK